MNFYKHHIGDYATATSHLSLIEDGAYSRLIRRYYSTEQPLPADPVAVARLVGVRSKAESAVVTAMLQEFFVLEDDGWHQKRCDEEISVAQGKAERNREIGKLGGRPHKTETQTVSKQKPNGNPDGFHSEPKHNPLQTPDSSNQTPVTNNHKDQDGGREKPRAARSATATRIAADFQLTDERRGYALQHGVDPDPTFAMFTTYWRSKSGAGATKVDWDATWQHWVLKDRKSSQPKKTRFDEIMEMRRANEE